jgi:RNA exonuclease 1
MGKGYKLTSVSGDGPKQCAFFFSDKGCRNGTNCKFSHDANAGEGGTPSAKPHVKPPTSVSSSSVMSSESESDGEIVEHEKKAGAYASLAKKNDDSNPFFSTPGLSSPAPVAAPLSATKEEQPANKKKKEKKRKTTESPFDLGTETHPPKNAPANQKGVAAVTSSPVAGAPQKKPKQSATTPNANDSTPNNTCSFRNLNLPIASFSLPSSNLTEAPGNKLPRPPSPQHEPAPPPVTLPLPVATPAHLKWKDAVIATRKHPNYDGAFSFERTKQNEVNLGISTPNSWITTRPYGDWCKNNPTSIAIDCEMCETKDPVTGKSDPKALCRLSVVNADDPSEVLLDTLVKPEWPVCDYRTWVNGITKKDLDGVQFTLRHAQMFMNTLCSEQTVVVGHAVHNDLLALKMVHHCNVDTAMLFSHPEDDDINKNSTPSLKNLAHGVLSREMPDTHDSVNDARVALLCAEHYVEKNGDVDPVEKVFARNHSRGGGERLRHADTSMMLVHRLPPNSKASHIMDMFLAFTCVKPKNVADVIFSGKHGKCHVEFTSKEHAELAYISLTGDEHEDKTGKKQKRVKLKNGDYVCVRKMKKN